MLRRVGGGGQCGVNCMSLHTTGKEDQATEIRTNINEHIMENWEEIYKYFYNFPLFYIFFKEIRDIVNW